MGRDENQVRFQTLAERAPVIVWMSDATGACIYISPYWQVVTGRDPEADLGFRWAAAVHPDDRERVSRDLVKAAQLREPFSAEYRVRRADGRYLSVYDYGVAHFHADGSFAGHIGTCVDITDHKNRERAGTRVKDHLLLGQESERKRVARELHDDISQRLALVCVALDEVDKQLVRGSHELAAALKAVRRQVEAIAHDVHRISHNLHPSTVRLGLVAALRGLCRDFSQQRRIAVDFVDNDVSAQLSQEVSLALFRVTQECLSNVVKHSGSHRARVSLVERADELVLAVADQGIGFDLDRLDLSAGLGLLGIRERARMIGAHVDIKSGTGGSGGTVVELRVPIGHATRD
jgi:PAS domain S-box-containing protein